MTTSTDAPQFSVATHNGTITIRNTQTGGYRTFRIRTQKADSKFAPGKRIVSLLIGSNNKNDYRGFAFIGDNGRVFVWSKMRSENDTFEKFADMLARPQHYESLGCEYLWSERCRCCNRKLTDPESIKSGIGPVCSQKSTSR